MSPAKQLTFALLLASRAAADVYMQYPPGSNNRLDEGGGNRNNNNRLMDTQNNAKGGYGYGGDAGNKAAPLKYMTGSQLSLAWTSQHSCGSENSECQIVWQMMCNDANGAAEDQDARTERKQRIAREKKRMIAALQAARIAYQARLIMATTAQ